MSENTEEKCIIYKSMKGKTVIPKGEVSSVLAKMRKNKAQGTNKIVIDMLWEQKQILETYRNA